MSYTVNEIFYSIQGEGARVGTANVFVRFSGCNLSCTTDGRNDTTPAGFDCDTEFASGRKLSLDELMAEIAKAGGPCKNVIFTGGEPALQLNKELVDALCTGGYYIAVETNGTKRLPEYLDWVSCSPKTAEHTLQVGDVNELRYVRHAGQAIPRPSLEAEYLFISPAHDPGTGFGDNLAACIQLVKENPQWRLSVQMHKLLKQR